MIDLRRLRPTSLTIAGLVGLVWAISGGAMRNFVWSDLREGMMTFGGLTTATRLYARLGFLLLGVMVVALIFSDVWRDNAPLVALTGSSSPRGQLVPAGLLPLAFFVLVTAWSFLLAGALHCHWSISYGALGIYLMNALGWLNSILGAASVDWRAASVCGAALLGVIVFFLYRRQRPIFAGLEFPVLFLLVSVIFLLAQNFELTNQRNYGFPLILAKADFNIAYLRWLIMPLLLLIGLDIAEFALKASEWATQVIEEKTSHFFAGLLLIALFGWRLYVAGAEFLTYRITPSPWEEIAAYGGALVEVLLIAVVYLAVRRLSRRGKEALTEEAVGEEAKAHAFPLVLLYSAVSFLLFILIGVAMALPTRWNLTAILPPIFRAVDFLTEHVVENWLIFLSVAALAASWWLARRGRGAIALYLGVLGVLQIWWRLTATGGWLSGLGWRTETPVDFWWAVVFALVALSWMVRRQMTPARVGALFLLLMLLTLMRQRNFIENPFTPFFGFAGIGFIAFGLVWDITTRGKWANESTLALPRVGRIFIYLGYVLLTATVLTWAVATHDLKSINDLTGGAALVGFDSFGKPLLYAVFLLVLFRPARAQTEH